MPRRLGRPLRELGGRHRRGVRDASTTRTVVTFVCIMVLTAGCVVAAYQFYRTSSVNQAVGAVGSHHHTRTEQSRLRSGGSAHSVAAGGGALQHAPGIATAAELGVHDATMRPDALAEGFVERTAPVRVYGAPRTLVDASGNPVDVVVPLRSLQCTTVQLVQRMNALHHPRFIWFISVHEENCNVLTLLALNVRCVPESVLFPDFSPAQLMDMWPSDERRRWSGSLFQQLAVMGAARQLPGLSPHYIAWSADAIPVSSEQKFFDEAGKAVFLTGAFHRGMSRPEARQQAVAHHQAFERLTGLRMLHPGPEFHVDAPTRLPDYLSETWEAHQLVVHRRYMDDLLSHIEARAKVHRGLWMRAVVAVINKDDHVYLPDAFSAAEVYGSWMRHRYPGNMQIRVESWRLWDSPGSVAMTGVDPWACCVSKQDLDKATSARKWYLLYDVAAFSGSTVCAKSAYNLAGVPSMLLDGPLPRTMTDFDRWAPGRPGGGGADGMVQASSGSGSGSRASTLGDLLSPLMSARSGEWDTRAAVVGGGVQPVAQVDSRA